jgi:hypothetical protein
LIALVRSSATLMDLLDTARALNLSSWCIGAGALRSLVWNHRHGFDHAVLGADVDLVFHDPAIGPEQDALLRRRLQQMRPSVQWDVTNQACVRMASSWRLCARWRKASRPGRNMRPASA